MDIAVAVAVKFRFRCRHSQRLRKRDHMTYAKPGMLPAK
jgi:hypothetical protein